MFILTDGSRIHPRTRVTLHRRIPEWAGCAGWCVTAAPDLIGFVAYPRMASSSGTRAVPCESRLSFPSSRTGEHSGSVSEDDGHAVKPHGRVRDSVRDDGSADGRCRAGTTGGHRSARAGDRFLGNFGHQSRSAPDVYAAAMWWRYSIRPSGPPEELGRSSTLGAKVTTSSSRASQSAWRAP